MARGVGIVSLNAVSGTTDGVAVRAGRRSYLSWSYERTGTVTGGVSVRLNVRLTENGAWFPVGSSYASNDGHYAFGSTPMLVYEARLVQTGAITGGGTITGRIIFA